MAVAAPPDKSLAETLRKAGVGTAAGKLKVEGSTIQGDGLSVSIKDVGSSKVAGDRRVWGGGSVQHVAQATKDGVQLLSVYEDRAKVHRISYEFHGRTLSLASDGSVAITKGGVAFGKGSDVSDLVGYIEKPWAKDAMGRAVQTRYEVSGSQLTQITTPSASTAYPVVADPTVSWATYGFYVRFSAWETEQIARGAGVCTTFLLYRGGHWVIRALAAFCASIYVWAESAQTIGWCIAIRAYTYPATWVRYVRPTYWRCY